MKSITYRPISFLLLNRTNLTIKNGREIFTAISIKNSINPLLSNISTAVSKELQKRIGFFNYKNTIHTSKKEPQKSILVERVNQSWFKQ
jgi:hypothetical protein